MRQWQWNLAGTLLSVAGASFGILGSLMMAHGYHPHSLRGYVLSLPYLAYLFVRHGTPRVRSCLARQQRFAQLNPENRALSLAGLCLVFFGFVLQLLGTLCSYAGTLAAP